MNTHNRKQLYEDTEICQYLINSITTTHSLNIRQSIIPGAGCALFATKYIAEGQEIFKSQPTVNCVSRDLMNTVCDFCYKDSESKLHPSGRFRRRGDEIQALVECKECRVCKYCSEFCRESAWKAYHKHECEILADISFVFPARIRALYRILARRKCGQISEREWRSIAYLESHYEKRMHGADANEIREVAVEARRRTGTEMGVEEVGRVYCALLTNTICIREAGQSKVLGTSIDVVMALMNHSCFPNALTIFEGGEMHVRSLRPIRAGEEVMQCYADVTCDVLLRRPMLERDFDFTCGCSRCEKETEAHNAITSNDRSKIEVIRQTQEQMTELINGTIVTMMSDPQSRSLLSPTELETKVKDLAARAYPDSQWPKNLDPMPLLWKRLGNMCSLQSQPLAALRYSIKGCAYTDVREGQEWNSDLLDLIRILISIVIQLDGEEDNEGLPGRKELWNSVLGYLNMLRKMADQNFGEETGYARALRRWLANVVEAADELEEGAWADGYEGRFGDVHGRLLAWAGVEKGQWVANG
ncbi:uncharacterized protein BCR38DRAFT_437070 [Pseudomassariella vexata]|uniref:Uncharacterized protein n=1 Tax=Pseudomassariella vexata TaxID=1141098 RepID=A0A1Y2DWF8_9PEZI|nr:uncharacterized protein BCR38DRAFT_437070 [Pseudomassariella vexata]ORY63529.1 hypothetical protein BCR38DRAFT_437070 [Pseudomassariella vexata]